TTTAEEQTSPSSVPTLSSTIPACTRHTSSTSASDAAVTAYLRGTPQTDDRRDDQNLLVAQGTTPSAYLGGGISASSPSSKKLPRPL
ncbi:unnamed protein product, partial [Amoebophrya sp. A25]